MRRQNKISAYSFQADQKGIDDLKDEFYSEAREYVCFRKGEWHGVLASFDYAVEWALENPEWVSTAVLCCRPAKDLLRSIAKATGAGVAEIKRRYFGRKKSGTINRRVICGPTVKKADIAEWERICGAGSVATIPKSQIGEFRYILNERRYAIFSRFGPQDLQGIIGTDKKTLTMLRDMFTKEFIVADTKKRLRQKRRKRSQGKGTVKK